MSEAGGESNHRRDVGLRRDAVLKEVNCFVQHGRTPGDLKSTVSHTSNYGFGPDRNIIGRPFVLSQGEGVSSITMGFVEIKDIETKVEALQVRPCREGHGFQESSGRGKEP